MYPLSALAAQHPAFAYTGFSQLSQPYPEHLKAAAMAGSLPLEHWIRAGIMMPRLQDYSCKPPYTVTHSNNCSNGNNSFKIGLNYY
jgi:homeobox protein HB9